MNSYDFVSSRSIPAVLCSNNWLSEINNQPSASNHEANENQVTQIPVVVQQVPDFDQDSWTKNNNNNNNQSSDSHEISNHAAASQASLNVCASDSDNHTTAELSAANGTTAESSAAAPGGAAPGGAGHAATTTTSSQPSQPQAANAVFHETMTTSAVADEPQATDEPGNDEQPAIKGGDVQESPSSASQDVVE